MGCALGLSSLDVLMAMVPGLGPHLSIDNVSQDAVSSRVPPKVSTKDTNTRLFRLVSSRRSTRPPPITRASEERDVIHQPCANLRLSRVERSILHIWSCCSQPSGNVWLSERQPSISTT